ncbi:MAG: hypothetical protein WC670_18305 [Pseudolabrys sp.]|jgi:hypothetical protein
MSASVHILPARVMLPCRRCGGRRKVTFDHLDEAQKQRAPFGAMHPCPDCGEDAEVIEIDQAARGATRQLNTFQRPESER